MRGKAGARSTASKVKGRRERRLKDDAIRDAGSGNAIFSSTLKMNYTA